MKLEDDAESTLWSLASSYEAHTESRYSRLSVGLRCQRLVGHNCIACT